MIHSPILFRVATLALGQSQDCPNASDETLKDTGKINWYQKHNKVSCSISHIVYISMKHVHISWHVLDTRNGRGMFTSWPSGKFTSSCQSTENPIKIRDTCSFVLLYLAVLLYFAFIIVTSHEHLGISSHRKLEYLFNHLFRLTTKKASKLVLLALHDRNPVTSGFPSIRASNVESVSML